MVNCFIVAGAIDGQALTFKITGKKLLFSNVQLKIRQSYHDNWNQDSIAQLTGININQKQQYGHKTNILNYLSDPSF